MHKDDKPYLMDIAKQIGAKHFSVAAMFKVVYPNKHGSWIVHMQDDLKKIMGRIVLEGMAVESTGPRGGAGWTLTKAGLEYGMKLWNAAHRVAA